MVREFSLSDSSDCEEFLSDKEVMKFIGNGKFDFSKTTSLEMVKWFIQCSSQQPFGTWAIVENTSNKVIGNCHISENKDIGEVEFGVSLNRKFWGRGYGVEVCSHLISFAKEKLGLERVVATTHIKNESSKKMLKNLGYRFEKFIELYGVKQELYVSQNENGET